MESKETDIHESEDIKVDESILSGFKTDIKKLSKLTKSTVGYKIDEDAPEESFYTEAVVLDDGKVSFATRFHLRIVDILSVYKSDIIIGAVMAFYLLISFSYFYSFVYDVAQLGFVDIPLRFGGEIPSQVLSGLYCFGLPILLWAKSTDYQFWNYRIYKMTTLRLMVSVMYLHAIAYVYRIAYAVTVPIIVRFDITTSATPLKIVGFVYLVTGLSMIVSAYFIWKHYLQTIFDDSINSEYFENYRLKHHIDLNPKRYSKYEYRMKYITHMNTGVKYIVTVLDRMLHCAVIAPTGGGKTSSAFLPGIADDLETRRVNEDKLKKELLKGIEKKQFRIKQPFDDFRFSKAFFEPYPGFEKEFNKIIKKYIVAGATIVAPDDSLTDKVYELCDNYQTPCNRMDPKWDAEGKNKENFVGFNPYYLSPSIPEWAQKSEIVKRAILFADVMQALSTMGEDKADPYFSSINRIVSTTLSIILMVAHPLLYKGQQANPLHLQDLVNDFDLIAAYTNAIRNFPDLADEYRVILDIAEKSFVSIEGRKRYEEHSQGFKVVLNNFLMSEHIQRVFTAEKVLDYDEALEHGEISVINIEQGDLGMTNSAALGLFATVTFVNAVLRRPGDEWSRNYHFGWFDEFPVYVTPALEPMFVLFRKFRVGVTVAMQTTDQMLRNSYLAYLKGIITNSCAHIIMFGRANGNDMELMSELGGYIDEFVEQNGTTETYISVDNPSISSMSRSTRQQTERVSKDSVRQKDFQEVTVLGTRNGTPVNAFHGKLHFLKPSMKKKKNRFKVNWNKLYKEQQMHEEYEMQKVAGGEEVFVEPKSRFEKSTSNVSVRNSRDEVSKKFDKTASHTRVRNGNVIDLDDMIQSINSEKRQTDQPSTSDLQNNSDEHQTEITKSLKETTTASKVSNLSDLSSLIAEVNEETNVSSEEKPPVSVGTSGKKENKIDETSEESTPKQAAFLDSEEHIEDSNDNLEPSENNAAKVNGVSVDDVSKLRSLISQEAEKIEKEPVPKSTLKKETKDILDNVKKNSSNSKPVTAPSEVDDSFISSDLLAQLTVDDDEN